MNISDLGKENFIPTKRHDGHTEMLEDKVDALEAEILSLKKQLNNKTKLPTDMVTKEQYDKILVQLQDYWDKAIPF